MAVAAGLVEDRPHFGISLMLCAWLLFSFVDTSAKWLALIGFVAFQLAFMRYFGHFLISIAVIARGGLTRDRLQTGHAGQVITRALLLITATVSNFYALNFLPLTVISAIMFSSPVIVCFLSPHLLNEQIGPWRWFAILLGFAGVLVVIRPLGAEFHWAMLLALFNAFSLALYSIMTRKLAGVVATETMQVYMGALGSALLLPLAIWSWQWPADLLQWSLLISLGIFGWAGHQLLTNAHRFGSANTLMPYTYSFMIYLTFMSYLVFDHLPDGWTVLGALIIVISGLIIWKREQR